MTAISRNGVSGLVLRVATIAMAAMMFGCAPKAAAVASQTSDPAVTMQKS